MSAAAVSLPGVHPRGHASYLAARLRRLGDEIRDVGRLLDRGVLRHATSADHGTIGDAVARLADAVLGLARHVTDDAA